MESVQTLEPIERKYVLCDLCGKPLPIQGSSFLSIVCDRCGHNIGKLKPKSLQMTMAFSTTALIFYAPAMFLPFMTMELYGNRNSATIWGGILQLSDAGSYFIAGVVLLASIIIPLIKLAILFFVSATANYTKLALTNTRLFQFVELIGRWSMLDIFLLAVLVAIMKLGPWTRVEPEPGALMFGFVVIFTMLASASFDPRLLWQNHSPLDQGVAEDHVV